MAGCGNDMARFELSRRVILEYIKEASSAGRVRPRRDAGDQCLIRLAKEGPGQAVGSSFLSFDIVESVQHQPGLGKGAHEVPESRPPKAVLRHEAELGVHAPGVLEPDHVDGAAWTLGRRAAARGEPQVL